MWNRISSVTKSIPIFLNELLVVIVACAAFSSCKKSQKFESNTNPKDTGDTKTNTNPPLISNPNPQISSTLSTSNSCAVKRESSSRNRPLDVFFSIDVSTSMTFTLEAVKTGIISFSENLAAKGYDVRFAGSGFVDRPNRYVIPFTDAAEFQAKVSKWEVLDDNNVDTQEGGQENLEKALEAILLAGRSDAVRVLIHVSDALAFAKGDHNNFDTSELAQTFKKAKDKLGSFMFFDSVPKKDFVSALFSAGESSHSPAKQLQEFRSQAGLPGIQLEFPFTAATLTDAALPNLIVSTEAETVVCK